VFGSIQSLSPSSNDENAEPIPASVAGLRPARINSTLGKSMDRDLTNEEKLLVEREFEARQAVAIRRRSFAHSVFIVGTVAGVGYAALLEFRVGTVASPILGILWLVCILIYVGLRVFPRSLAEDMDPRWHLNPWRSALQNLSEGRTQVEAIALLAGPPLARMLFSFLYFGLK